MEQISHQLPLPTPPRYSESSIVVDRTARILEIDTTLHALRHCIPEECLGMRLNELLPALEPLLYQVLASGARLIDIPVHSGSYEWLVCCEPICARSGTVIAVDMIIRDLSPDHSAPHDHVPERILPAPDQHERNALIEALRESEKRYHQLFDNHPLPLWIFDTHTLEFLTVNDAVIDLYGYTREEFLAMTIADIRPHEAIPALIQKVAHLNPGLDHAQLWQHRKKDGTIFQVEITTYGLTFAGRTARLVVIHDITNQLRAEEALFASEARYSAMAEAVPAMLFTNTPDGACDYVNRHFIDYTGYSLEESLGAGWIRVLHPDDFTRTLEQWQESANTGKIFIIEYRLRRFDGIYHWFRSHSVPLHDPRGAILKWFGVCIDIEDIKRAEKVRDSFLSVAAHELKTPLTALFGHVQLLQRRIARAEHLPPHIAHSLHVIAEQADRLHRMVLMLLDIGRLEQGQLGLELVRLELVEFIRQIVEKSQLTLDLHTIDFTAFSTLLWISGDPLRLEQVMQNLLQNAVKYSPQGGQISVQVKQDAHNAHIIVSDEGIGIPESALPHLFERFYRAPNVDERQISGMGIGLYLVQEIVTLHGGWIEVSSTEERGSCFTVMLPLI